MLEAEVDEVEVLSVVEVIKEVVVDVLVEVLWVGVARQLVDGEDVDAPSLEVDEETQLSTEVEQSHHDVDTC